MAEKIIYHKGKLGSNSDWDDRALIKAYDEAVKSFKEKMQDDSTSEASQRDRKKDKKIKKKTPNHKEGTKCQWNIGDKCMAKYSEDGLHYEAIVLSIDYAHSSCRVKYSYYDNEEDQRWEDLQPVECNNVPISLNYQGNGHLDASDAPLEERSFSRRSRNSSLSSHSNSLLNHHLPQVPPPPLPDLSSITNETEALHGMLISWYMSGYYTGYYKGLSTSKKV